MITKLLAWLPANIAGLIGIAQAVVKLLKEIITLVINILLPIIPGDKFDAVVMKARDIVNSVDAWLEKMKSYFLPTVA